MRLLKSAIGMIRGLCTLELSLGNFMIIYCCIVIIIRNIYEISKLSGFCKYKSFILDRHGCLNRFGLKGGLRFVEKIQYLIRVL